MSEHEDNNDQQDHHHHHEPDPDEQRRWLDSPANVKKVIRWFFISCVVVALLDAVVKANSMAALSLNRNFFGLNRANNENRTG